MWVRKLGCPTILLLSTAAYTAVVDNTRKDSHVSVSAEGPVVSESSNSALGCWFPGLRLNVIVPGRLRYIFRGQWPYKANGKLKNGGRVGGIYRLSDVDCSNGRLNFRLLPKRDSSVNIVCTVAMDEERDESMRTGATTPSSQRSLQVGACELNCDWENRKGTAFTPFEEPLCAHHSQAKLEVALVEHIARMRNAAKSQSARSRPDVLDAPVATRLPASSIGRSPGSISAATQSLTAADRERGFQGLRDAMSHCVDIGSPGTKLGCYESACKEIARAQAGDPESARLGNLSNQCQRDLSAARDARNTDTVLRREDSARDAVDQYIKLQMCSAEASNTSVATQLERDNLIRICMAK